MDLFLVVTPLDFLANFTFRTMAIGTTLIGATSGALGTFLYLRKQSLISDVIGHSAIFGVMVAFVVASTVFGINGRSMVVLTIGAVVCSTLSALLANWIASVSQLRIDAAMVISLSIFYGAGMVMLQRIVHSSLPNRGGIDKYMFGNAATLGTGDIFAIGMFSTLAIGVMLLLWKEFKVFTFDPVLAQSIGFSPRILGPVLAIATTIAVVIGVKAVGLVLMIAFAIMPAAAARQWVHHLWSMVAVSSTIGGGAGLVGSYVAVNFGKVPTGPVVVLILFAVFTFSLLFAPERSVIRRYFVRRAKMRELQREVGAESSKSCGFTARAKTRPTETDFGTPAATCSFAPAENDRHALVETHLFASAEKNPPATTCPFTSAEAFERR
jgi:manganese/zinc/iron transport system permease protein